LGIDLAKSDSPSFFGFTLGRTISEEAIRTGLGGSVRRTQILANFGYHLDAERRALVRGHAGVTYAMSPNPKVNSQLDPTAGVSFEYQLISRRRQNLRLQASYLYSGRRLGSFPFVKNNLQLDESNPDAAISQGNLITLGFVLGFDLY
jgi:hypothetical protein